MSRAAVLADGLRQADDLVLGLSQGSGARASASPTVSPSA